MDKTIDNLTEVLQDLRKRLPRGGVKRIAKRAKVTRQTVHNVFNEVTYNEKVVDALIEVVNEYESEDYQQKERDRRAAYIASKLNLKKETQTANV